MTKIEKSSISTLLGICRKSGVLLAVFRLNLADKSVLGTQGMGPQFLDFFSFSLCSFTTHEFKDVGIVKTLDLEKGVSSRLLVALR
jgi:hypothetical protein